MSYIDPSGSVAGYGSGIAGEGKERGSRRKRVYGYLKAANELRQTYQSQWVQKTGDSEDERGLPGSFPDVEVVRNGDEEMVLFPSYARRHIRKQTAHREPPGAHEDLRNPESAGDAQYWKKQWDRFEDDNAIVDVDVRGWLYSPHRGPMTRKNRLLVAVARRLSGIPAPVSAPTSRASSRNSMNRTRLDESSTRNEEEMAAKEAQKIVQKGEGEASAAVKGGYSEEPSRPPADDSPYSSRPSSPDPRDPTPGYLRKSMTDSSLASDTDEAESISKRHTWQPPERMTKDELANANDHLLTRLKPFMTVPLTGTPITIFFFNDDKSQSRTVRTNESGHFTVRASLDFIPTNVRVLASENLSASEEVRIIESQGVSMISDIDDTIKHSAISSGAKEIFRNTFIRDLTDLTVQGVKEWYTKMYGMGVKMHYVSNSPWQLYPLLRSYFGLAGLPPGSFHLKAYTGMLQGIFEPAAERKRGSLEKILRDFPERKFVLVGDSGEADLEVYTDTVLENPGRVLGIFIRDVTTEEPRKFFESYAGNRGSSDPHGKRPGDGSSVKSRASDRADDRPSLPPRGSQAPSTSNKPEQAVGNLIDLDDDPISKPPQQTYSSATDLAELNEIGKKAPPQRPSKPLSLRSNSHRPIGEVLTPANPESSGSSASSGQKSVPPPPPKPRRGGAQPQTIETRQRPTPRRAPFSSPIQSLGSSEAATSPEEDGYAVSARKQISAAYNALPSARGYLGSNNDNQEAGSYSSDGGSKPPPPPRRGITTYPAAAAQYASNRLSWNSDNASAGSGQGQHPTYNKKDEMWRRRWARAEDMLRKERVVLRSWRVGSDVMDEAVQLVERALRNVDQGDTEKQQNGRGGSR